MEETIVTDWNLVCDKYFMKGHAHLFYSFGFLIGCILSGLASDKYVPLSNYPRKFSNSVLVESPQ